MLEEGLAELEKERGCSGIVEGILVYRAPAQTSQVFRQPSPVNEDVMSQSSLQRPYDMLSSSGLVTDVCNRENTDTPAAALENLHATARRLENESLPDSQTCASDTDIVAN